MAGAFDTIARQLPGVTIRKLATALGILVLASVVAWVAGTAPAVAAGATTTGRASVVVAPDTASPGQQVQVIAAGLPPSKDAEVELCGDLDLTGSADCALDVATGGPTSPSGTLTVPLTVEVPPVPCPCVVAVSVDGQPIAGATTAVSVTGAPTGPLSPVAAPAADVRVVSLSVETPFDWKTLVGGAPRGTLVLRLRNDGGAAAALPIATVEAGAGGRAATSLSPAPLGPLSPGETRTWTIPLSFPALDYGGIAVRVVVPLPGEHLVAVTRVADIPWVPLGILALIILLAGWAVVRRLRRILRHRQERVPDVGEVTQPVGPPVGPGADGAEGPGTGHQPAGGSRGAQSTGPAPVDGQVPAFAGNGDHAATGPSARTGTTGSTSATSDCSRHSGRSRRSGNDSDDAREPSSASASVQGTRSTARYHWEEEVWFMGREEPRRGDHSATDGRTGHEDRIGRDAENRRAPGPR